MATAGGAYYFTRHSQRPADRLPGDCYLQQVQCIKAPCNPVLICPGASPIPVSGTPLPTPTPAANFNIYQKSPYRHTLFGASFNFVSSKYVVEETDNFSQNDQSTISLNVRDKAASECMVTGRAGGSCSLSDNRIDLVQITLFRNLANKSLDSIAHQSYLSDQSTVQPAVVASKSGILVREPVGMRSGHWQFIFADKYSNRIASFVSELNPQTNSELQQLIKSFSFSGPPGNSPQTSACKVAGCSGQLCVEATAEGMSTCEYRAEYACYKTATCERQTNGSCGWAQTPELKSCLNNPPSLQ